ncbi:LOW QUALITY PROTEIN: hypothetical protein HID58_059747, partial [Brassica napus]
FIRCRQIPHNRKHKLYKIQRLHNECVENADRWVTGFLEIFEEGFIRRGLRPEGVVSKRENSQKQTGERDEDEYKRHYARIKMLKKRKRKLLKTDAKDNKIILLMTWKGSEKGIVHDNDDVISRENHKEVNLYSYVTVGSSGDDLDAMAEPLPRVNKAGGRVSYMIKPRGSNIYNPTTLQFVVLTLVVSRKPIGFSSIEK